MTDVTYETASGRLESIIERLDSGEAGLRETLELVPRGPRARRVLRRRARRREPGPRCAAPRRARRSPRGLGSARDQHLGAPGRSAAADRRLRARAAAHERLERLRAPQHRHPPPRRRHGRASARTSPTRPPSTRRPEAGPSSRSRAPGRSASFGEHVAGARPLPGRALERDVYRRYRRWGYESRGARPRAAPGRAALHEALGREPRPMTFVVSLRLGEPASLEPLQQRLDELPVAALQARPDADLDRRAHRRARRHGRGRQRRLQGPLRGHGRRRRRRPRALPPRRRGVPGRVVRGPAAHRRRSTRSSSPTATGSPGTRRSTASPTSRRCRSRRGWSTSSRRGSAASRALFDAYDWLRRARHRRVRRRAVRARPRPRADPAAWPRSSIRRRRTTSRPPASTSTIRPRGCPTSPTGSRARRRPACAGPIAPQA